MKHVITLLSLISLLIAGSVSAATDVVTVVDENQQPVGNATILFGYDTNDPFPGNVLTTNAQGLATVPAAWKAALPVTAQAAGFVAATIPVATPGTMTIQMNHQEAATEIQVAGTPTGFGTMVDNGKVQFGLVIPALSHDQLLTFDLSTVISPQTDNISVLSQSIDIPSNLTLPDQTVTYVFPVTFNKPDYRSYVRNNGSYLMTAIHGNFILSKVVSEIRAGKSIFDMINDLTFVEGGTQAVTVNGDTANQNIPVNQTQFTNSVSVTAPTFPAAQVMVSLALNPQNGLMLPTDMKRLTSGQTMPLKSAGTAPSVLSLLMVNSNPTFKGTFEQTLATLSPANAFITKTSSPSDAAPQNFKQLSYALQPAANGAAPQFITLIDPPSLDATTNVIKMTAPAVPTGLTAVATYLVMTEIQSFGSGAAASEQRTRLWEIFAPSWISQLELPKVSFAHNPNRTYRWEVLFLAQPSTIPGGTKRVNGVDLQSVTHVTRNALAL